MRRRLTRLNPAAFVILAVVVGYALTRPSAPRPGAPARDTATFLIGTHVRMNRAFYGCPTVATLYKVREMLEARDLVAVTQAAARGGCAELQTGDEGTVTDHSVFHGATSVRRTGVPDCDWVPDGAIEAR